MQPIIAGFLATAIIAIVIGIGISNYDLISNLSIMIYSNIHRVLHSNQYIQTVLFGSIGGSFIYLIQFISLFLWQRFYSMYRSDVTIRNTDTNYPAIIEYITENFLSQHVGAKSNMQVTTKKKSVG